MAGFVPGSAPDSSDFIAEYVRTVPDPSSQRLFQYLIEEQRKVYGALNVSISASNAAVVGLSAVNETLQHTRSQLDTLIPHLSQIMSLARSSPISSTTGGSGDTVVSEVSTSSPDGVLKCPFCPHGHDSEKVHVQHMMRLMDRLGTDSRSECLISPSNSLINHHLFKVEGDFVKSAANFIKRYCVHLNSSHKKGVDVLRLRKLQAFMESLR